MLVRREPEHVSEPLDAVAMKFPRMVLQKADLAEKPQDCRMISLNICVVGGPSSCFGFLLCSPDPPGETDVAHDTVKRGGSISQRLVSTHRLAFLLGESRALARSPAFGQ